MPDPDPAKIATCRRRTARSSRAGSAETSEVPRTKADGALVRPAGAGMSATRSGEPSVDADRPAAAPVLPSVRLAAPTPGSAAPPPGRSAPPPGRSAAASSRAVRSRDVPLAGRRAVSHSRRWGCWRSNMVRSAAKVARSSRSRRCTMPPAAVKAASASCVFAPWPQAVLRSRNNRRRGLPAAIPDMTQALVMRGRIARPWPEVIARNDHCACSPVSALRVWDSRACSGGRALGLGSRLKPRRVPPFSVIQAVSPAFSSSGMTMSSLAGVTLGTVATSSANTASSSARYGPAGGGVTVTGTGSAELSSGSSAGVACSSPGGRPADFSAPAFSAPAFSAPAFSAPAFSASGASGVAKSSSSRTTPADRQVSRCRSMRCSSSRGV